MNIFLIFAEPKMLQRTMNKNFIFKSEGLKQDSLFFPFFFLVRASSGAGQTSEPSTDCYSEPFLFPRCVERLDIPWQRNTEHLISFLLHTSQVFIVRW